MVSRIAKSPIKLPHGVEVKIVGQTLTVKGKFGELSQLIPQSVKVVQSEGVLQFEPTDNLSASNMLAGTSRALVNNMIHGVAEGFQRKLVMVGVGYRAKAQDKKLNLSVGFSHPVDLVMPEGVKVETPSPTEIVVTGANKQKVSQVAANIRAIRPPEPYKGKGIKYDGEHIVRKEAK